MAKSKKEDGEGKEKSKGNASVANILEKYGDIMVSGTGLLDRILTMFSVSPAIDFGLSGGIPEGSFMGMSGPPGCGKSTTALQIIANCQKPENNFWGEKDYKDGKRVGPGTPRKIFFVDVEHRLKRMNMLGVVGLDPKRVEVIKSIKGQILSAQDFLDIIEEIVKDEANEGCIIVVDSASALCPADEMVAATSGQLRTTQPKVMSHWCKKMASPMKVMSATIIMIQHVITNTSGYGEKWMVDGGEKMKFAFDINMTTRNMPEKWLEEGSLVGQVIEWKIIKSAMGASGGTVKSCLRYGKGLDITKELFLIAVDIGVIDKGGAWYYIEKGTENEVKAQGEAKMCQYLEDNPDVYNSIRQQVYSYIGA